MKKPVLLSIRGRQSYLDQEPEVIELVTEGTMAWKGDVWSVSYEETDLTGMQGVTTTFLMKPGRVTLDRKGPINSQMVFQEGVSHDSLYKLDFGALMITVCATKVSYDLTPEGGSIDLVYHIEIEQNAAGVIDYHLDIKTK